jgi:threonine dehydratase
MILTRNFEVPKQSFSKQSTMPPIADYSRPTTPENGTNGVFSPRTPKQTGLALTEYTANPSPPSDDLKSKAQEAVPQAFILPNGTPDVR